MTALRRSARKRPGAARRPSARGRGRSAWRPSAWERGRSAWRRPACERGQAALLLVALLCALLVGAAVLGLLARGLGAHGEQQRAADLAALAAARTMHDRYPRLFEPPLIDRVPNPRHLERADYLQAAREAAGSVARANGAQTVEVSFPAADPVAPTRVRVEVGNDITLTVQGAHRVAAVTATAEAALEPAGSLATTAASWGDEYDGPLATRQGHRMRPDVAAAFDRMAAAAAADDVHLVIDSAFRTNAEQARLFAAHPDPRWVAPPGESLHRLGTELDLGPPSAYGWLTANAGRFHFVQRYSWEPWHYGFTLNPASAKALSARREDAGRAIPSFVPSAYVEPIAAAAQRWNVSATLLAAQLDRESGFNPFAISPAGARGIAQLMPGTASDYGLDDPFDAARSIDAQAHLMRDLLRRFGSVPLALAAYNAGPDRVAACGCIPPIPETTAYVAAILGLMAGAGDPAAAGGLEVHLVS